MNNLRKDSRGMAHLLLIFIVVGVVGFSSFAVWRISSYNSDNQNTGEETVTQSGKTGNSSDVSEECVAQTGDINICRLGGLSDPSKHSSVVTMDMNGMKSVIKYDGKGNSDAQIGDIGRSIEVNGKTYIYMMDAWYDSGEDNSQAPDDQMPDLGFATTAGINYENQGKVKCGNDTCFKYRMSEGILEDGVVTVLFGDKDYLPRRYESTGGMLGKLTLTIDYQPITIEAPAGAKPLSSLYGS